MPSLNLNLELLAVGLNKGLQSHSVFGRPLDVVDDQEFDGPSGRRQFQSELFLYRSKDRRLGWVGGCCGGCIRNRSTQSWCDLVACELQPNVKPAGCACLIDYRP